MQELLHPGEMDRFVARCAPTAPEELAGLRLRVQAHLAWVRNQAVLHPPTDIETAARVADTLARLLDEPDQYDGGQRALLHGAVDYFVLREDDRDDLHSALGFDDDVRVVNALLDALGRTDLRIEFT